MPQNFTEHMEELEKAKDNKPEQARDWIATYLGLEKDVR